MEGERYFKVVLSESQLRIVDIALEQLSAGDPESEAENIATILAVRNTTEEIR